jgi:chromosome segregation ATPase
LTAGQTQERKTIFCAKGRSQERKNPAQCREWKKQAFKNNVFKIESFHKSGSVSTRKFAGSGELRRVGRDLESKAHEVNELRKQLEASDRNVEDLRSHARKEHDASMQQLRDLTEQIQGKERELEATVDQVSQLRQQSQADAVSAERKDAKIASLKSQLADYEAKVQQLKAEMLENYKSKAGKLKEKVTEMFSDLDRANATVASLTEENAILQTQIKHCRQSPASAYDPQLASLLAQKDSVISALRDELADAGGRCLATQREVESLRESLEDAQAVAAEGQTRIQSLTANMQDRLEQSDIDLSSSQRKVEETKTLVDNAESAIRQLRTPDRKRRTVSSQGGRRHQSRQTSESTGTAQGSQRESRRPFTGARRAG